MTGPSTTGSAISDALANDSATNVELTSVVGMPSALEALRSAAFEIVLIAHEPGGLDALELLEAIRTGSHPRQAILVVGDTPASRLEVSCLESGADGYICLRNATTRGLLWHMTRAIERQQLIQENEQLTRARRQQRRADKDEVSRVLDLLRDLRPPRSRRQAPPNPQWVARYQPVLQAYVMMGGGRLDSELDDWIATCRRLSIGAEDVLAIHCQAVEKMVDQLGGRGARHILHRAQILAVDILLRMT